MPLGESADRGEPHGLGGRLGSALGSVCPTAHEVHRDVGGGGVIREGDEAAEHGLLLAQLESQTATEGQVLAESAFERAHRAPAFSGQG